MTEIYPNYYKKFKCIAGDCQHSCCVGWEIDIDEDTLCYYDTLEGNIKNRLDTSISREATPHFILNGERCPFLNKDGLCDIIIELGENGLCDICNEHPRFRNYYENCVEIGLGLCCEAVGELILKSELSFELDNFNFDYYNQEELSIVKTRQALINVMKERSLSIKERHSKILEMLDCEMPELSISEWCDFFIGLERLDEKWTELLVTLKNTDVKDVYDDCEYDIAIEQLTIYFLYRYVNAELMTKSSACFAIQSARMIMAMLKVRNDSVVEYARLYSSEIEYCEENVEKCLEMFEKNLTI